MKDFGYDWGESLKVLQSAPARYRIFEAGSVCGIRVIENASTAEQFREPIGTVLYLVEGAAGDAIEIPERYLARL